MSYLFPGTIYDQPQALLAALGSFWAELYAGREEVAAIVEGKALVEQQSQLDLLHHLACLSRLTVPLFRSENLYPIYIRQSDLTQTAVAPMNYDAGNLYGNDHRYDELEIQPGYSVPVPAEIQTAPVLINRITDPSMVLTDGLDVRLTAGRLTFRNNPFDDPRVARRTLYQNGEAVDSEALLWIYRGEWDLDAVYRQFGYVLGVRLRSSAGYRELLNVVFDSLTTGTASHQVDRMFSALTGVPLVREAEETVEVAEYDQGRLLIITDQHVYTFHETAVATVTVGDRVVRGQSLTDALQVHELNRGVVPEDLQALCLGPGLLANCFFSELLFENRRVALQVDTEHVSGFTYVRWDLGGFPSDVDRFFDEMHTRGVAAATAPLDPCVDEATVLYPANDCDQTDQSVRRGTLAHLLDQRSVRVGEPGPANLPTHINPLQFLIQNVLRHNACIVWLRAAALGSDRLGLAHAALLRKTLPPHLAVIVVVRLDMVDELVSATDVMETLTALDAAEPLQEDVPGDALQVDTPVLQVVNGFCQ